MAKTFGHSRGQASLLDAPAEQDEKEIRGPYGTSLYDECYAPACAALSPRRLANRLRRLLTFSGLKLSNVDVEVADRVSLELFLRRLAAFDLRQSADAVALETAMQG